MFNGIVAGWNWFASQNLSVQVIFIVGILKILISGLKQLGLTQLSDFCLKIENALLAMTSAAKDAFVTSLRKPKSPEKATS